MCTAAEVEKCPGSMRSYIRTSVLSSPSLLGARWLLHAPSARSVKVPIVARGAEVVRIFRKKIPQQQILDDEHASDFGAL